MANGNTILQHQLNRAKELLERNRSACEHLAASLMERSELSGREVMEALNDRIQPRKDPE
ncbi:hypothetical protein ASE23_08590 [Rhizobium sp. Root73]|nr:hypothetical protein ASE23_08590 [Rhizobium sp. Root73]